MRWIKLYSLLKIYVFFKKNKKTCIIYGVVCKQYWQWPTIQAAVLFWWGTMLLLNRSTFNDSCCDAIPPLPLPNILCQWEKCINTGYWQTPRLTYEWGNYPAPSHPTMLIFDHKVWKMHTELKIGIIYAIAQSVIVSNWEFPKKFYVHSGHCKISAHYFQLQNKCCPIFIKQHVFDVLFYVSFELSSVF